MLIISSSWIWALVSLTILLIFAFRKHIRLFWDRWIPSAANQSDDLDYSAGEDRIFDDTETRQHAGFEVTSNHPHKNH